MKKLNVLMAEEEGDAVVGTGNDARVKLLQQISDQNDEAQADQFADIVDIDKGITEPFVVKKADGSEEALGTEKVVTEEIIDHDDVKPVVVKHKIKVNGVEQEVTLEELMARAQKVSSADQYLQEAARIRNELEAQKLSPKKDAAVDQEAIEADDLALARAIQMGSEEEAQAAIRKIRESVAPVADKGPSPDDLAKTIDDRLVFNEAISKFNSEYKDLIADKNLHKMVLDRDSELIAKGDRRPYYERYAEIGNEVRDWVKQFQPVKADTKVVDKVARKAEVTSVPKAAGAKTGSSVEEEKEESVSDVIAGIAAARGGPQWMTGMPKPS